MRFALLAATAALLASCGVEPVAWRAELVPVGLVPAEAAASPETPKPRQCPPLKREVFAEAQRLTLLDRALTGGQDLTAALMISEVEKNRRLREVARAYEACRRS